MRQAPILPILAAACLCAASCNDSRHDPALTVTGIQPIPFVAYRETAFTVLGSGFTRTGTTSVTEGVVDDRPLPAQQPVTVAFRAQSGTPFNDGTSDYVAVAGTVVSDTEITGTLPGTSGPGGWLCTIDVTDARGTASTPTPASLFLGLTVFDIDREVIPADQATPFEVFGLTFLPLGGNATVRFTSTTPAAFPGGVSTLDVPGTIVDGTHVTGTTPVLALASPVQAFVSVVLDQEPGAPEAISNCVLVEFQPPPIVPVVVTSIAPPSMPIATATAFTITGSGFAGAADATVQVTFTASSGTPLVGGTALVVTVPGTVVNDTTVTGTSPTGTSSTDVHAFVSVARSDGVHGTSATDIALFTAPVPSVSDFAPSTAPADTATAFAITGLNLPTSPATATVRFRTTSGTPFTGGTTDSVDVVASIASATLITGNTPLATTASDFLAEVTVFLQSGVELPMGVRCLFTAPQAPVPPTCLVTNLANSGIGSLRETLATATPGCIITFDPSLSGALDVTSTLNVAVPVTILGPDTSVIAVTGAGPFPDFPIFTIQPAAAGTEILRLTVTGSRHNNDGGGFRVRGDLTLRRCVVSDNRIAGRGAALCITDGAGASLIECTLRDNGTTNRGSTFVGNGSTLAASGCTFDTNESNDGGGGVALDGNTTFDGTNCTFYANRANGGSGGGGLLVSSNATANLVHCTFAENCCNSRGGGVVVQGTMNAVNCIFSRNSAGQEFPEIWATGVNHTSFSLVRVGDGSRVLDGFDGNMVGTKFLPKDARLDEIAFNGGPTQTMALQTHSPARDAGTTTSTPKDQRGVLRPQGPAPDMGAYEANVTL